MTATANTTNWLEILTAVDAEITADMDARRAAGVVFHLLPAGRDGQDLANEVELILGYYLATESTPEGRYLVANTPAEAHAARYAVELLGL